MKAIHRLLLFLMALTLTGMHQPAHALIAPDALLSSPPPIRFNTDLASRASAAERAQAQINIARWAERLSATAAGTPTTDERARQSQAAWTVMVYIAADNDLEAFALSDLNEMELVGSTTGVNIVVQLDRAAGYDDTNGDWTDTRRFLMTRDDDFDNIMTQPVQTLGETNTGNPQALVDFATWAMQTYPAQRYALIIWDHGGGWLGIASDDSADGDDLSLPEVAQALSQISAARGAPLDLVGFDACLMAQYEVYRTVAPYALYGVAAEETIPGFGWDYATPLNALAGNPAMDGEAFGRAIVDSYMSFYTEVVTYYDVFDLGLMDLSQADNVLNALNGFSSAVQANPGTVLSAIGDARNNTTVFGGFDDPQYFDIWSAADLIQFMDLMTTLSPDRAVTQAAQNVVNAGSQMVVHHQANETLAGARGMAVYFPRNREAYGQYNFAARYAEAAPSDMTAWQTFLETFFNTATQTTTEGPATQGLDVRILGVYPSDVVSIHDPAVVQLEVAGRDILDVSFYATMEMNDGTSVVVDFVRLVSATTTETGQEITNWADGVSTRTFVWDAEAPVISDGLVEVPTLLIQNRENPTSAVTDGIFTSQMGQTVDAQLVYDLTSGTVSSVWGIRETATGFAPFELPVKPGDTFQPLWVFLNANNELNTTPADQTLTFSGEPFSYRLIPAPSGSYTLSVVVEDIAGSTVSDSLPITVSNDGLDTGQRGFTNTQFGVNFRYPTDWIAPRYIQTEDGERLFTGDPASGVVLSVLPYDGATSALDVAQQVIDSWNQLQNAELVNQQQVQVAGHDAYVVDYTYTLDGQERVGAVLALYVADQGIGYGFDMDAPASAVDVATEAFSLLVESVNFFNTSEMLGTSNWAPVSSGGGLVSFSVPVEWAETQAGDWTIYSPAGDTTTFIALNVSSAQGLSNEQLAEQYFALLQQNTNVSNVQVFTSEPYFIGNEAWHVVGFTYTNATTGQLSAGAYFVTTVGTQEYVFWLEAPDAVFDQTFENFFSVVINSFTFNG